jgi:transcription elongation factor Elf1
MGRPKLPRIVLPLDTIWTCRRCGQQKPLKEFCKTKRARLGYLHRCKKCHCASEKARPKAAAARARARHRAREKYHSDPRERQRVLASSKKHRHKSHLKKCYGLTPVDIQAMLRAQCWRCAICNRPFESAPHVDHDHRRRVVRGLLCSSCNLGLGKFRDDPCILDRASAYLLRTCVREAAS